MLHRRSGTASWVVRHGALQGDNADRGRSSVDGAEVGPVPVVPGEPARLCEDAALPVLDVQGTELHRAGGVEEPAVTCFQDSEAGPPECRVEAEGPGTA